MRRLVVLVIALGAAACGARAAGGPTWPKSAGTERLGDATDDGGESLTPRTPAAFAAIEASADDEPPPPAPVAAAKPAAAPAAAAPTAAAPAAPDPEQPIMLDFEEEIVIDGSSP